MKLRVGQGFDLHAFGPGDRVRLGGVDIPHDRGLVAHSDGDCVVHALCDALLGAASLGDIGRHFPDDDPRWAGADSRMLLRHCVKLVREHGWRPQNADLTVIAQSPRVAPHVARMVDNLAADLGIAQDAVNVKATTTERLGSIGNNEGLAALAVVLLTGA